MMPLHSGNSMPEIYIADPECPVGSLLLDCDCGACVEQVSAKILPPVFIGNTSRFADTSCVLSDNVLTAPVNNYISVFHRTHGDLLILNNKGYELLREFERSARIRDVVKKQHSIPASVTEAFCTVLHELGIVRSVELEEANPEITSHADTLIAWIHLTDQCNLQCQYCYIHKSCRQMTKSTAKLAIEKLFVLAASRGYKRIKLKYTGGEPTLNTDSLIHTHLLAEELSEIFRIEVEGNILTNGVLIPEQLIEFSLRHHLKWAVSLDGCGKQHDVQRPLKNGHGSFGQILASIDRLQHRGILPHIPITLTRHNLNGLPALVEFLLDKQLRFSINFYRQTRYSLNRLGFYPDSKDLVDTLDNTYRVIEKSLPDYSLLSLLLDRVNFKSPHLHPCAAGRNYLVVGPQGNFLPCQMLVSDNGSSALHSGNDSAVLHDGNGNIALHDGFKNIAVVEKEGCTDCSWRYFCAGGCPMEAFHAYGRFDIGSPYCGVYRALAPRVLRLETLRLLKYKHIKNYRDLV